MTEQRHTITPPPELVQQWLREANNNFLETIHSQVAAKAAQWGADQVNADIERKRQEGADQELKACCEWLALEMLNTVGKMKVAVPEITDTIRRALEEL